MEGPHVREVVGTKHNNVRIVLQDAMSEHHRGSMSKFVSSCLILPTGGWQKICSRIELLKSDTVVFIPNSTMFGLASMEARFSLSEMDQENG